MRGFLVYGRQKPAVCNRKLRQLGVGQRRWKLLLRSFQVLYPMALQVLLRPKRRLPSGAAAVGPASLPIGDNSRLTAHWNFTPCNLPTA